MTDRIRSRRMARRLDRQFEALGRIAPPARWALASLRRRRLAAIRIPVGLALVLGGVLSILPFLGLWMLPLGLMLLAVDLPLLRPAVTTALIRLRRRADLWARRLRRTGSARRGR